MRCARSLLLVLSGCSSPPAPLPDPCILERGDGSPPATLADLAWLEGTWRGEGLGGVVEESWSAPAGGAMLGMFRLLRAGRPVFYELCLLVEQRGSLLLRVKHFGPDFAGWEERADSVDFPLVRLAPATAWFGGATYHRTSPDALDVWVRIRRRDGGATDERLRYRRAGG
jgi:hypothetical protein